MDLARYDVDTAAAMLETERLLYVGFMCHQSLEKSLKAFWEYVREDLPPRTHNLRLLARELGLWDELDETHRELILTLEPLNVQTRYPEDRHALEKTLSRQMCRKLIDHTMRWLEWIEKKLSNG